MLSDSCLYKAINLPQNLQLTISVVLLCLLGIVVKIEAKPVSSGSGVVIDSRRHIVTNSHVVVFEREDKKVPLR